MAGALEMRGVEERNGGADGEVAERRDEEGQGGSDWSPEETVSGLGRANSNVSGRKGLKSKAGELGDPKKEHKAEDKGDAGKGESALKVVGG